ncbi:MAG: preprotein translocase subunit YajC [Myxococcota bacterium]|jgi:preprotein translocase subunit YajC
MISSLLAFIFQPLIKINIMTNFFSNIFVSDSFAQGTEAAAATSEVGFSNFVPLIAIFLVFYFLLIRPQQKKMKAHQKTLGDLKKGDKVQTTSGIFGVIKSMDDKDNSVKLEIAEGVEIKILKQSVSVVNADKNVAAKKSPAKKVAAKKPNKKIK